VHQMFMKKAIDLSRRALEEAGTAPFGAVVVKDEVIVGEGLNRAVARGDPTAHGEIEAIRDACTKLRCIDLSGCDLYTSCEPCSLCVAAIHIAGIRHLFYAASLEQSARALSDVRANRRSPIDSKDLQEQVALPPSRRRMRSTQLLGGDAVAVLERWAAACRDIG
jgi:guanine deaminase